MTSIVGETERSSATPLFLPQLDGERAPYWDSTLKGAFLGVSRRTQKEDFARAVYEGVAFAARQALEVAMSSSGVKSGKINCGGGGFRSASWNQIRSNVIGRSLRILASSEPGVLGAITLAAKGLDIFPNLETANSKLMRFSQEYNPEPTKVEKLNKIFEIYSNAISSNVEIGRRLSTVNGER